MVCLRPTNSSRLYFDSAQNLSLTEVICPSASVIETIACSSITLRRSPLSWLEIPASPAPSLTLEIATSSACMTTPPYAMLHELASPKGNQPSHGANRGG